MPVGKRSAEEVNDGATTPPNSKAPRTNGSDGDFSGSVKKKSAGSTRTGQACDRCKIRKIRCDARPGGCSPCLQNNTECRTTDRITGRATSRGYTENIENENATLRMYTAELQQQLRDSGVEPRAPPRMPQVAASAPDSEPPYWPAAAQYAPWDAQQQNSNHSISAEPRSLNERRGSQGSLLPDFRVGCIGGNYLGVTSENSWLSPIEGTSLALFGAKIDVAEYMPPESDSVTAALSYQTFLDHAFGRAKPFTPTLPPYDQCKVYAEWYFRSIQQLIPLLHKPDFMRLLDQIYHQNYPPSAAETVMVHMVLAIINFQFAIRNSNEQARIDSVSHYHYALSFIPDLVAGHKLEDIQALAVICAQLRSSPRPGAAWMFTNMVLGLAIESGLHRSEKAFQGSAVLDAHEREMRKRTFWGILCYHVHISGKLGRPMPLRLEDFDIELPVAVDDSLPEETDLSPWRRCSWRAALEGYKLVRIMMQVYSTIYSIKSVGQYETSLQQLEKELDEWQAQVPPELRGGPQTRDEVRIASLYLDLAFAECQILLHHPSLCRSFSPQVINHNLDVCLHWSSKILSTAIQLKNLKGLDTTWYYATVFIAALFTTLFANTARKDQLTSSDLQRLRDDMDQWLDVLGEVGTMLGSGPKLQNALGSIVEFALSDISRHLATKTASAAVASTDSSTSQDHPQAPQFYHPSDYSNAYPESSGPSDEAVAAQSHPHPNGHMPYPNPPSHSMASYPPGNMANFANPAYPSEDVKPTIDQLGVHTSPLESHSHAPPHHAPPDFLATYPPPHVHDANGFPSSTHGSASLNGQAVFQHSGPTAWRNFATSMMTNMNGQEYMNSAGALMALSGGKPLDASMDMVAANVAALGGVPIPPSDGSTQPWPLLHYNTAAGEE